MRLTVSQSAVPAAAAAARGAARRVAPPRVAAAPAGVSRRSARLVPPRSAAGSEPAAAAGAALSGNPLRPNETVAEAAKRRAAETEAVQARLKVRCPWDAPPCAPLREACAACVRCRSAVVLRRTPPRGAAWPPHSKAHGGQLQPPTWRHRHGSGPRAALRPPAQR